MKGYWKCVCGKWVADWRVCCPACYAPADPPMLTGEASNPSQRQAEDEPRRIEQRAAKAGAQ